jgi:transposase
LNSTSLPPIPLETAKAARAVFGRSNFYLAVGDQSEYLFAGLSLEDPSGNIQKTPRQFAILYLITIFQYVETLPDPLAADAMRERVDWKYALHLPLNNPGMKPDAFCKFRQWLKVEPAGKHNLHSLMARLAEVTEFLGKPSEIPEACQVVNFVCEISRLADIWEVFKQAVEALAATRPAWLLTNSLPYWYERYGSHHGNLLPRENAQENQALADAVGADGIYLLEAVIKAGDPELGRLAAVRALGEAWKEQYVIIEGKPAWRKNACATCALLGSSSQAGVGGYPDFRRWE